MTVRTTRRLARGAFAVVLLFLLSACGRRVLPQDTLNSAGPEGHKINSLFWPVFWIAVGVFVLVEGLLVVALVRFRARPGRGIPKQVHGNKRLEVTWTIIPAVLLAGVAIPTIGTIFSLAAKPAQALTINVTGHQWWWEVRYPSLNVTTANEIHIPVGQPVLVYVTSVDVIHSFWVPRLAGKQDLEPGRINHVTIEASEPGTYLGQCAEYCGFSHANMRLRVMAEPAVQFQAWAAQEKQPAATPPAGSLSAQGAQDFATGACVGCHTVNGVKNAAGTLGPNLTHFGSRTTFAGATFANTAPNLELWLRDPPAIKPGADMPDLHLTQDQINALIAYLQSLK
jgi:cytochrome c oxidase subunit 2